MFSIYWMNQHDKDWTDDFLFRTKTEAKTYLEDQGYQESGGWYRREPVGWEGKTRALIVPMKIYGADKELAAK